MTGAGDPKARMHPFISPQVDVLEGVLRRTERRTYWAAVGLPMATSLLDLAGVLLFGMVGVIAASLPKESRSRTRSRRCCRGLASRCSQRPQRALSSRDSQPFCWSSRRIASLWILRWITKFLTTSSARISAQMCADFFSLPIVHVNRFASQWSAFALVHGVTGAIVEHTHQRDGHLGGTQPPWRPRRGPPADSTPSSPCSPSGTSD